MLKDGEIPKYNLTQPRTSPVMDLYREVIETILKEDEQAPVKQRHTAVCIYERLRDEYGFTGGESTVRRYVRQMKKVTPETFLMLEAAAL